MSEEVARLKAHAVDAAEVNAWLAEHWGELVTSGKVEQALAGAGGEPVKLDPVHSPFEAKPAEGQFFEVGVLLIAFAKGAAGTAGGIAVKTIWEQVVWPRLQRHFGQKLEPKA